VAAFGPAAAENSSTSFGLHAAEEAVNLGTAATVGLKCALRHDLLSCMRTGFDSGSLELRSTSREQRLYVLRETHLPQQDSSISKLRKTGNQLLLTGMG
jgi:hypothetical protein